MQVNYDVPIIQEITSVRSKSDRLRKMNNALHKKDLISFDKILADFFWFYGQRYQIWNHVISLNIGRWQERRIQDQQKFYLPNQKRYGLCFCWLLKQKIIINETMTISMKN